MDGRPGVVDARGRASASEARALLYGFTEYHLERRMKSAARSLREDRAVSSYLSDIDRDPCRAHVAIVMDGNGRWAKQRGLPRTEGHDAGEEALFDAVKGGVEVGLEWLTVYAFSTENWKRPPARCGTCMNFNRDAPAAPPRRAARR